MQSLRTLLEREEAERDAALAALDEARSRARAALLQSEQLLACRAEYQQRWSRQLAQHGATQVVHCYHAFTQRLGRAIAQQQHIAHHAQGQLERTSTELNACELRVASVRTLIGLRTARGIGPSNSPAS